MQESQRGPVGRPVEGTIWDVQQGGGGGETHVHDIGVCFLHLVEQNHRMGVAPAVWTEPSWLSGLFLFGLFFLVHSPEQITAPQAGRVDPALVAAARCAEAGGHRAAVCAQHFECLHDAEAVHLTVSVSCPPSPKPASHGTHLWKWRKSPYIASEQCRMASTDSFTRPQICETKYGAETARACYRLWRRRLRQLRLGT